VVVTALRVGRLPAVLALLQEAFPQVGSALLQEAFPQVGLALLQEAFPRAGLDLLQEAFPRAGLDLRRAELRQASVLLRVLREADMGLLADREGTGPRREWPTLNF
jgi:hypothetical protein